MLPAQQTLSKNSFRFSISFPKEKSPTPLDGRVLLMLSADSTQEPRFQISDDADTQLLFGVNVDGLKPGEAAMIDGSVLGYPIKSLAGIEPGWYWVQALLHRYETFYRKDGHVVKLPMDRGEGQQWNRAPGNLYSAPKKMWIDPRKNAIVKITLDQEIPPIEPPKDTKYIKHVKMQSKLLTEFWGRPMYLGACVLLPEGFDTHPQARYPLAIFHGHFPHTFGGFRETPPDPNLKPDYSKRFNIHGYNKIVQEYAYQFYKDWTGPNFPRMVIIEIQHANPYYDDSYAVNSANLGPYGDAITYELIPFVEKQFRCIGEGWARFLYGGSTGGWEALAAQIFYPDEYNGCWAACPDPIDFRAYTIVNIYAHENAYYVDSKFKKTPRPGKRNYLGELSATLEEMNHRELVLGTHSRSGDQWDIWQAVYSPVGADGYPKPIWDKLTGKIDRSVAEYWRENYDLGYILKRDWPKIGKKLQGKIHIYCGDMDNYYLNNAVYLVEDILKSTKDPHYDGEVDYGDRAEHCWNGDHERPNAISRLRYHQMHAPKILKRIRKSAPAGADTTSWRY
ncbi:MAG: alpha/beta hydrolase-fold protein [candidate division KSB1 bacterium]|nr:alpha/beta hydrolase-fold protein [candidate division KSB1 bacterium]MDZ7365777.1 alpha/beta hydrolase-fold protein [candidate division KSB1 bacterium]MDZ7403744.1 alpha/beta hydrolase-fold protein [candidate division KSB1 bacterium]